MTWNYLKTRTGTLGTGDPQVIDDSQAPPGIDASVATAARMYDYWLGGHDNFAADRIAALKVADAAPEVPVLARENRKFLRRAVRFLAAQGIEQFLDLGTGLPTRGNVHQVSFRADRWHRVRTVRSLPAARSLASNLQRQGLQVRIR